MMVMKTRFLCINGHQRQVEVQAVFKCSTGEQGVGEGNSRPTIRSQTATLTPWPVPDAARESCG